MVNNRFDELPVDMQQLILDLKAQAEKRDLDIHILTCPQCGAYPNLGGGLCNLCHEDFVRPFFSNSQVARRSRSTSLVGACTVM